MTAPMIFCDVDGVVKHFRLEGEWRRRHRLQLSIDAAPFPGWYSPDVVRFLSDFHVSGRAEVRWLTHWGEKARTELTPLIGLPDFEVQAVHPNLPWMPKSRRPDWWKWSEVRSFVSRSSRPVVWIDDDLKYDRSAMKWAARQPQLLTVVPTWWSGLQPQHITSIEQFLDQCADQDDREAV